MHSGGSRRFYIPYITVGTVETDQFLKEEMKVSGTPAAAVTLDSNLDAAK
jgi:hypothetical protein